MTTTVLTSSTGPPAVSARPGWDVAGSQQQREQLLQLGVWMFLATVTMLFAAFTSAYLVRRGGTDWRPIVLPSVLWLNTAVLVGSSSVLEYGRRAAVRRQWWAARFGFITAIGLGIGFLGGQLVAWQVLVGQGVYIPTVPHSSFFYLLTGLHGVHLVAGLTVLAATVPSFSARPGPVDGASPEVRAGLAATFWHFFGGVWLYLLALLSWF